MPCLLQRAYRANLEFKHPPKTAKRAKNSLNGTISDTEGGKQPENGKLQNSPKGQFRRWVAHRRRVLCQVHARASALVADLAIFKGGKHGASGGGKGRGKVAGAIDRSAKCLFIAGLLH